MDRRGIAEEWTQNVLMIKPILRQLRDLGALIPVPYINIDSYQAMCMDPPGLHFLLCCDIAH